MYFENTHRLERIRNIILKVSKKKDLDSLSNSFFNKLHHWLAPSSWFNITFSIRVTCPSACATYKTLGSVHFVRQNSSTVSSSSKIFSTESLNIFMSVSNSDRLSQTWERNRKEYTYECIHIYCRLKTATYIHVYKQKQQNWGTPYIIKDFEKQWHACVFYLLLFCRSTCSLLLSAERILGSKRDSSTSNMTGSTSFSRACRVFACWHRYHKASDVRPWLSVC